MRSMDYTLDRLERAGIHVEYGDMERPGGKTTFWAKAGNISVYGRRSAGWAINALVDAMDEQVEGCESERKRLEEEAKSKKFEYADPRHGNVQKVNSGYLAMPQIGKPLTFPTVREAAEYLQSISRAHRYIKKKR